MELKRVKAADVYPSEGNPREDMGDLEALAASFELNPAHPGEPLNPPLLVQDGGVYRIVDGERRWRAMGLAGTKEFDAVVCEDWADADAALAMLATDDKKPLDEVERSRGVQRALLLGVEPQKVERAARRKGLRKVKKAVERLGAEAELMSLDHLLAVAELADAHPELSDKVANADEGAWERVYRDARAQVERERDAQALRDKAAELRLHLEEGAERPEGMSYELTCRTPEDLEAAAEEYAGGALYSLSVNAWNGARVVVYTALPDEEADPEREAAKERRDAMAQRVEDMVHSVCAFIVPKLMRPTAGTELRNCMEEAAKEWLGPRGSQWSKGAMASRWLDEAEWEGARPDGSASGMVAACIARDWLATAEPNRTVLGMACGLDEMSDYGRDQLAHLLDAMGAAAGDGWEPSREDMALMAELSAACKEDESEEL
ncbi:ParB N-terminal domain-containing protein [uncultured Parolsenella sp.]|uniref:ParB/RepB/Spo0J family partition protein n=1 Tax=uncultured Parolsenella sp. TaxID=2083008 RepID=UPI0025EEE974|nr:ParB N-terminal domain-containing protein [uncultured Parolsenella sp.]